MYTSLPSNRSSLKQTIQIAYTNLRKTMRITSIVTANILECQYLIILLIRTYLATYFVLFCFIATSIFEVEICWIYSLKRARHFIISTKETWLGFQEWLNRWGMNRLGYISKFTKMHINNDVCTYLHKPWISGFSKIQNSVTAVITKLGRNPFKHGMLFVYYYIFNNHN